MSLLSSLNLNIFLCLQLLKQVTDVRAELSDIGYDLNTIHALVSGLVGFFFF